jgi:hypothetical protein
LVKPIFFEQFLKGTKTGLIASGSFLNLIHYHIHYIFPAWTVFTKGSLPLATGYAYVNPAAVASDSHLIT